MVYELLSLCIIFDAEAQTLPDIIIQKTKNSNTP